MNFVNGVIDFADQWQTLLGSLLGGFFGLWIALIVVRAQEFREQRAAAAVIDPDFLMFWGAASVLRKKYPNPESDITHLSQWVEFILRDAPVRSSLFDQMMTKLLELDGPLDHHLVFFRGAAQRFERLVEELKPHRNLILRIGPGIPAGLEMAAYDLYAALADGAWHGERGDKILRKLALTRWPRLHRILRALSTRARKEEIALIEMRFEERRILQAVWVSQHLSEGALAAE
jgi:hypothetical protein